MVWNSHALFSISLLVSLGFSGSGLAADMNLTEASEFLLEQRNIVSIYEQININHIQQLQSCLCHTDHDLTSDPRCSSQVRSSERYRQIYLTIDGVLTDRDFSCTEMLDGFLYRRIRENYPKAKKALALSQSRLRDDNKVLSETIPGDQRHKISLTGHHPVVANVGQLSRLVNRFEYDEPDEIRAIESEYDQMSQSFCEEFSTLIFSSDPQWKQLRAQLVIDERVLPKGSLCAFLLEPPSMWSAVEASRYNMLLRIQPVYMRWAHTRRDKFREQKKAEYLDAINKTPIILLLSSDKPKGTEIYDALSIIEENALRRQESLVQLEANQSIPDRVSAYRAGQLNQDEKAELVDDLKHYATYSYAREITLTILKGKGIEIGIDIPSQIAAKHQKQESRRTMLQAGAILGANIACFLPLGKLIGAIKHTIFRSGCLINMGVPINFFFMVDSLVEHNQTLSRFLATQEGRYYWRQLEQLETSKKALILSSQLLPLGMAADQYPAFIRALKGQ